MKDVDHKLLIGQVILGGICFLMAVYVFGYLIYTDMNPYKHNLNDLFIVKIQGYGVLETNQYIVKSARISDDFDYMIKIKNFKRIEKKLNSNYQMYDMNLYSVIGPQGSSFIVREVQKGWLEIIIKDKGVKQSE